MSPHKLSLVPAQTVWSIDQSSLHADSKKSYVSSYISSDETNLVEVENISSLQGLVVVCFCGRSFLQLPPIPFKIPLLDYQTSMVSSGPVTRYCRSVEMQDETMIARTARTRTRNNLQQQTTTTTAAAAKTGKTHATKILDILLHIFTSLLCPKPKKETGVSCGGLERALQSSMTQRGLKRPAPDDAAAVDDFAAMAAAVGSCGGLAGVSGDGCVLGWWGSGLQSRFQVVCSISLKDGF